MNIGNIALFAVKGLIGMINKEIFKEYDKLKLEHDKLKEKSKEMSKRLK